MGHHVTFSLRLHCADISKFRISSRPQRVRTSHLTVEIGKELDQFVLQAGECVCVCSLVPTRTCWHIGQKKPTPSTVSVRGAPARPASNQSTLLGEKLQVARCVRCDQERNDRKRAYFVKRELARKSTGHQAGTCLRRQEDAGTRSRED